VRLFRAAARRPAGALAAVAASAFGLAFCMTLLWFGMRDVMDLGGFVASGGPYEIAHPAPDWVWIMPVSIVLGLACAFGNVVAAWRADGFNLALPAWGALFVSLGWNFLEYGLRPPGGGGPVWGWLVCAVVFFAMGLPVIPMLIKGTGPLVSPRGVRRRPSALRMSGGVVFETGTPAADAYAGRPWKAYLGLNLAAIACGIAAGWALFSAVSG
jgi:hypothetical protein